MARKTHTEAQARYDKVHRRVYGFRLHNDIDSDIIARLAEVDSMQGYIKQLIRNDIKATKSVPVSMCEEARQLLQEEADKRNMDVCDFARLIINQWVLQNKIST